MSIKLLSKSDIAAEKAKAKALEVAEGLKISRKVDALREMLAKEEEKVEKWHHETIAKITNDIFELEKKKEALLGEIKQLEEQKKELDGISD